jgi:hypothetical protein
MRRIQIVIDQELDDALAREARAQGVSKSALIRALVGARLKPLPPLEEDPLWEWMNSGEDGEPTGSVSVDDVVYPIDGPT